MALYERNEQELKEMKKRGYNHASSLHKDLAVRKKVRDRFVNTISEQREILKLKNCECIIGP